MFFFQMPLVPEFFLSLSDYYAFDQMFAQLRGKGGQLIQLSDEELEAYKYTFSRPGQCIDLILL